MRTPRTLVHVLLAGLAAVATVVALAATPAAAHEGDAVFGVETAEPQPDGSVRYVVRVTFEDDGDAALDATVTATAVDGAGATQTPVPMTPVDQDGRYEATVTFPAAGAWTIRFTAINPNGTFEQAQEVAATTTTAAPSTTAEETTTAEAETASTEAAAASSSDSDDGGGGGGGGAVAVVVILVVLVAAGVGGFLALRRRGGGSSDSTSTPSTPAGDAGTEAENVTEGA
jgi:hypothetical protein